MVEIKKSPYCHFDDYQSY